MIEEDFLIFQAPRECINLPCAWIHVPSQKKNVKKGPVKITYDKKNCYLQCRTFDDTYRKHTSYVNITRRCRKDYVILMSEHYREILGIEKDYITTSNNFKKIYDEKKCKLKISYPRNKIENYLYYFMAAWKHPDIYAKTSIVIAIVSLFLGLLGFLLGLPRINLFSDLLSPKNSLLRDIYLFSIGGVAGYICAHLFSEKITKATWIVFIILMFAVLCLILYIFQYSSDKHLYNIAITTL